jgi:hypothetical protein
MGVKQHLASGMALLLAGVVFAGSAAADYIPGRGYALVEDYWGEGDFFIVEFDLTTAVMTDSWLHDRTVDIEGMAFGTDWAGIAGDRLYGISANDELVSLPPGPEEVYSGVGGRLGDDAGLDVFNDSMYNLNGVRSDNAADRRTYLYRIDDTNTFTALGTMNAAYADNIAFAADGTAYAMDWYYSSALYSVDLGNGELSWVGSLGSVEDQHWAGSAYYDGTLYALLDNGHLYTVDTVTGAATFVDQLRQPDGSPWDHCAGGMAIYVPEPGTVLLFGFAALFLRRRR